MHRLHGSAWALLGILSAVGACDGGKAAQAEHRETDGKDPKSAGDSTPSASDADETSGATDVAVAADAAALCKISDEVLADALIPVEQRTGFMARKFAERDLAEATLATMRAAAAVPDDERYALIVDGLSKAGAPGWSCPSLKTLFEVPPLPACEPSGPVDIGVMSVYVEPNGSFHVFVPEAQPEVVAQHFTGDFKAAAAKIKELEALVDDVRVAVAGDDHEFFGDLNAELGTLEHQNCADSDAWRKLAGPAK